MTTRTFPTLTLLLVAGCAVVPEAAVEPLDGTEVDFEAPGLAFARISHGTASTTLDANGVGTLFLPEVFEVVTYSETDRRVVDAFGSPVMFQVSLLYRTTGIELECLPPQAVGPVDRITVLVRRDLASGRCAGIALQIESEGMTTTGSYTPERFDDQPCWPWGG